MDDDNYNDQVANYDEDAASQESWSATEQGISFYFFVFLSLLAVVLILSRYLHDQPKLASMLPEAGMTIMIGIVAGYFVYLFSPPAEENNLDDDATMNNVAEGLLTFSSNIFFVALLPPIIFNSGYHLKRELFFRHLKPIVLLACLGTAISAAVIAMILELVTRAGLTGDFHPTFTELATFGSLISATDPVSTLAVFQAKRVDPRLFYLVFGESVLNDAVGLVLFTAVAKFVGNENDFETVTVAVFHFLLDFMISFVGSFFLGILSGVLAALLLNKVDMRKTGLLELSLYVLFMYLPFFLAEIFELSGIVTILFTGIAAKRYAEPNLTPDTENEADTLFRITAHLAETSIFLELGLSVFGLVSNYGHFYWRFMLWAMLACLVGRAANVYPISFFFNRSLRIGRAAKEIRKKRGVRPADIDDEDEGIAEKFDVLSPQREDEATVTTTESDITETPRTVRDLKIRMNTAHMLWFAGLRGAVAYACAKNFPNDYGNQTAFVVTTMGIVLITVFLLGGTTEVMLKTLKIDMDVDEGRYMENQGDRFEKGFFQTFGTKYISPYVIRDYETDRAEVEEDNELLGPIELVEMHGGKRQDGGHNSPLTTPQGMAQPYVGHPIEVTERLHLNLMRRSGYLSEESFARRKSLYDYGAR